MTDLVECPYCGLTFEDNAEYVDVGFGPRGVQVTGNVCDRCGASERGAYASRSQMDKACAWFPPRFPGFAPEGLEWLDAVLENVFAMGARDGRHWAPSPADAPDLAPVLGGREKEVTTCEF